MGMTPDEFDAACKPIFKLKRYIDRIELELAQTRSERDKALADNARLRAALQACADVDQLMLNPVTAANAAIYTARAALERPHD